jgi:ABC-type dipeptide/oligopeptide/nickel transport system permease subunit
MVFIALFPQLLAPVRPVFQACDLSNARQPPQAGAPFGYDSLGCDVFDGVIWGARPSISIGVITTIGVVLIGVFLGSLAGFYGGWVDGVISRLTDVMFGFPFLVGAIVILTAFPRRNQWTVILVLVVFGWASLTRIMRSSVFSARSMDYVMAARALGASNSRIMFRHILPNAVTPVLVLATVGVGAIIGAEATLTFLGVGLQPPANSWGLSISQAQNRVTQAPHMLLFPGIFLSITVLAFIVMGDAVRDAFDPKLR